jgi:hypothetical protein
MIGYIKRAFAILCAASIGAGCSLGRYTPVPAPNAAPESSLRAVESVSLGSPELRRVVDRIPDVKSLCTEPAAKIPGTYALLSTAGEVRDATYKTSKGSAWGFFKLEQYGNPAPTPIPTISPAPQAHPIYVYYGTFTLDKKAHGGCFVLIASVNGKPIVSGYKYNAGAVGAPRVVAKDYYVVDVEAGYANIVIRNLSAKGGAGTLVLKSKSLKSIVAKGTIKLTGRITVK